MFLKEIKIQSSTVEWQVESGPALKGEHRTKYRWLGEGGLEDVKGTRGQ